MLIATPAIYLVLRKLTTSDTNDIEAPGPTINAGNGHDISNENMNILKKIGWFVV